MKLDLKDIIEVPGASLSFTCPFAPDELETPPGVSFRSAPHAEGRVENTAGALTLTGMLHADLLCHCDRCGKPFEMTKELPLSAPLAAELEDEENPDIFLLEGNELDLTQVLATCWLLDLDMKFLCREDCKGLCDRCGADLNEGPCGCGKTVDPRMAVLEQLLDK